MVSAYRLPAMKQEVGEVRPNGAVHDLYPVVGFVNAVTTVQPCHCVVKSQPRSGVGSITGQSPIDLTPLAVLSPWP